MQVHEAKHLSGEVLNPGEEIHFKCPVLVGDEEIPCDKVALLYNSKIVSRVNKRYLSISIE